MIFRLVTFTLVLCVYFLTPWWCALLAAVFYAVFWPGYELLILAVAVDSVFGHAQFSTLPYYTLMTSGVVIGAAIVKPFISFYDAEA